MKMSGWGRFPVYTAQVHAPRSETEIADHIGQGDLIARGNGRAYGDSAINQSKTLDMRRFNKMISFDPETGVLVAEAGVKLSEIIACFLPRGWFPAVTPGTKFVTLGGAIAADVHGKNHHNDGSFSAFVEWCDLMDTNGAVQRCSQTQNPDLFKWTLGGMGLTGVILRAAIRLRPVETGWIRQTTRAAANLKAALAMLEEGNTATYSVAWIDCLGSGASLGRSLIMLGEHATLNELASSQRANPFPKRRGKSFAVPMDAPAGLLNRGTVKAFNSLYYYRGRRKADTRLVDWDSYFYPLDSILDWNRIYGRQGFVQFQCVLPPERSEAGLTALLKATSAAGQGSFLAVLKRFGAGSSSGFSFPTEGYTLALDFPATPKALALVDTLDQIALEHEGRFYLAKDARMTPDTLRSSDKRTETFMDMRKNEKLPQYFSSEQSKRLGI